MELFWRRGYHATSLSDLTEHLGIGRASLYATFGPKHELYVRPLDRYRCTRTPSPVEVLGRPGPALPAIRTLLDTWANTAAAAEPRSEEHTSELQSRQYLVCRLLLDKKNN